MDDLMQAPVVYLDEGLGAFYWPQQYKKDVGFTALYTADQMREYAKKAVEAAKADERERCAKFFDLNDTNIFWGSQAARHIRDRASD